MEIEFKDNKLIFWFDKSSETRIVNGFLRSQFENNNFTTDRCWRSKDKKIGVRICLLKRKEKLK